MMTNTVQSDLFKDLILKTTILHQGNYSFVKLVTTSHRGWRPCPHIWYSPPYWCGRPTSSSIL